MKRPGRVLVNLLVSLLAVFSLQAVAAEAPARSFDHAATGFPLNGGHATTACETCHVGGVFKGTPRNCEGCHALGKRVVATPKSTSHIVTDAPCDTCHFNTSTFLGARYNHGTAVPGQCSTCHNGRITTGRPANHNVGFMLTASCDQCHRTYSFFPASWNHTGVVLGGHTCKDAGCHVPGTNNRYTAATATAPVSHSYVDTSSQSCDVCHVSFVSWNVTMHEPQTGTCSSCHNGTQAQGKSAGHVATTDECNACHTSTVTWLGALGAKPANHIPYNAGVSCGQCHTGGATAVHGPALHAYLTGVTGGCATCHIKPGNTTYPWGQQAKSSHDGSSGSNCTGCHEHTVAAGYVRWN